MESEKPKLWLDVREAAEFLGLSRSVVYQMAASGQIDHYKVGPNGGRLRFRQADLDAYLERCRVGRPVKVETAPPRRPYVPKHDMSNPVDDKRPRFVPTYSKPSSSKGR